VIEAPVNGHQEIWLGGLVFSGLAATSFPGWWPRVLPAGGVRLPAGSPLSCEAFGEPVRVALGQDQVGVVQEPVDGGEGLGHDRDPQPWKMTDG
jgi:hypothetical protein